MIVMAVKESEQVVAALSRTEAALRKATDDLQRTKASVLELAESAPSGTVRELSEQFNISEDAVRAFAETAGELLGGEPLSVADARRGAMLATARVAWERELGPLLIGAQVRELLGGVSRQRVDELLRGRRLIGLRERSGRRRYPLFQFDEGASLAPLVAAFWIVAEGTVSEWTAASWCVRSDPALDDGSPVAWIRAGKDPERVLRIARQDARRLEQ